MGSHCCLWGACVAVVMVVVLVALMPASATQSLYSVKVVPWTGHTLPDFPQRVPMLQEATHETQSGVQTTPSLESWFVQCTTIYTPPPL